MICTQDTMDSVRRLISTTLQSDVHHVTKRGLCVCRAFKFHLHSGGCKDHLDRVTRVDRNGLHRRGCDRARGRCLLLRCEGRHRRVLRERDVQRDEYGRLARIVAAWHLHPYLAHDSVDMHVLHMLAPASWPVPTAL